MTAICLQVCNEYIQFGKQEKKILSIFIADIVQAYDESYL